MQVQPPGAVCGKRRRQLAGQAAVVLKPVRVRLLLLLQASLVQLLLLLLLRLLCVLLLVRRRRPDAGRCRADGSTGKLAHRSHLQRKAGFSADQQRAQASKVAGPGCNWGVVDGVGMRKLQPLAGDGTAACRS